jgi:hypothetical protein
MSKFFYSCVDSLIPSPLSEQHTVIKHKAEKENGRITAYGSEEVRAVHTQPWIIQKLRETKNLNGVIFFTATQFMYSGNFNIKVFHYILAKLGLEVHFARENLTFNEKYNTDLNQSLNLGHLIVYSQIFLRKDMEIISIN